MKKKTTHDNPRNTKPISLHPFSPEEALRRAMSIKPPQKPEAKVKEQKG